MIVANLLLAVFAVQPRLPLQGALLQVTAPDAAATVRLDDRTPVPLFSDPATQEKQGILAIPVLLPPGPHQLTWLSAQGEVIQTEPIAVRNAHFARQYVTLSKQVAELHSTADERDQVGRFLQGATPERDWTMPLQPPLNSCTTSPFGVQRYLNGKATGDFHAGLDQRGTAGTPIHAIAKGTVTLAGQFAVHGGTVGIDHGQGFKSMYLHMSRIAAQPGDKVQAGDIIGYVGSTGRSTAPHLHWSIYAHGDPVNPLQFVHLTPCAAAGKAPVRHRPGKTTANPVPQSP